MSQVVETKSALGHTEGVVTEHISSIMPSIDISRVLAWSGRTIRIFGTNDKPWFHGSDIAKSLGYTNVSKALTDHVKLKNKLSGIDISRYNPGLYLDQYEKQANYVNEAGMYSLIMRSKLKDAEAFQDWVTDEVLPSIRKTGEYRMNTQLQTLTTELANQCLLTDKTKKRADDAEAGVVTITAQLNRLHIQNSSLIRGKMFEDKKESVYIVASQHYASQGIFKLGRTKSMVSRLGNHNTSHVVGDYHVTLKEYKVNNSTLMEHYLHSKLQHLLIKGESEFFKVRYQNLQAFVQSVVDADDTASTSANSLVDDRFLLEREEFKSCDWMTGIPAETFGPSYYQPANAVPGKISIADITDEKKLKVAREAITSYLKTEKNIDYALPIDAARVIEPKIKIKWGDLFGVIKARLQHGESAKFMKQQAEWSLLFVTLLTSAIGIEFITYRPPKIKPTAAATTTAATTTAVRVHPNVIQSKPLTDVIVSV